MKRNIILVLVLVVGALAVAALVLWIWRTVNGGDAGARAPAAPKDLEAEVRSLEAEIEKLERRIEAPRPPVAPGRGSAPAEPAEELDAPARPVRTPEESSNAAAAVLEERLSSEPVDAGWAHGAARGIEQSITANAAGTKVRNAECGSTLCRVVVEHDTVEARNGLGRALVKEGPFRAGVLYKYSDEGSPLVTTLYVLREGQAFREAPADP